MGRVKGLRELKMLKGPTQREDWIHMRRQRYRMNLFKRRYAFDIREGAYGAAAG